MRKLIITLVGGLHMTLLSAMPGPSTVLGSPLNPLEGLLVLDSKDIEGATYKNFRTTSDPYRDDVITKVRNKELHILDTSALEKSWEELTAEDKKGILYATTPERAGLDKMKMSGSSQFGRAALQDILHRLEGTYGAKATVIVDLREEPHGFLNEEGVPFSLYGEGDAFSRGKDWSQLEHVETQVVSLVNSMGEQRKKLFIQQITGIDKGVITDTKVHTLSVESACREDALVAAFDSGYIRLGFTDHHRPEDDDLDDFRKHFDALPRGVWKHFKCRAGVGRTTTGMVLFDMMENYRNPALTFEDIVMRHHFIGGANLLAPVTSDPKKAWKAKAAFLRAKMLWNYYKYLNNTGEVGRVYYRQWLAGLKKA